MASPIFLTERIVIKNSNGDNLVGLLHDTGSVELVIICHGLATTKEDSVIEMLIHPITNKGVSVFRFDFAGHGESEGSCHFGDYLNQVEDLRSVVQYFSGGKHAIITILGESKGANVVLLYPSKYSDSPPIINVSGCLSMEKLLKFRLGNDFLETIKQNGFINVYNENGELSFCITEESYKEHLAIDMRARCLSIEKHCRFFTVHGTGDKDAPVEDALEFAKILPNHQLQLVEGANHSYTQHQAECCKVVCSFIDACLPHGKVTFRKKTESEILANAF